MIHAGAISHAHVGSASVLVGDIDDALDSEKDGVLHSFVVLKLIKMFAHTNPLHLDVFKSVACFEAEVVAMTAALLGSKEKNSGGQICGNMTPSGTELLYKLVQVGVLQVQLLRRLLYKLHWTMLVALVVLIAQQFNLVEAVTTQIPSGTMLLMPLISIIKIIISTVVIISTNPNVASGNSLDVDNDAFRRMEIASHRLDELQPASDEVISRSITGLKLHMVAPFLA
ncbi:hypothetical protein JHK82_040061 [Glycine max]|nr:hypothetical protein JHK82_040061 [Glycine max]